VAKQKTGNGKIGINGIFKVARLFVRAVLGLVLLYRRLRYGYAFRRIRFSGPRYAKVDPEDYERLAAYEWYYVKGTCNFYAARAAHAAESGKTVAMHRDLIEVPEGMLVDHINHDSVDNRKANLRPATRAQNACNRRKFRGATSKYKGVTLRKATGKWTARICIHRRSIHIGCFEKEIEAAKAYDNAARKYHGEFAALNFPESRKTRRSKR